MNMVNREAVRAYALEVARQTGRADVMTRVGASVYTELERVMRARLRDMVHRHPSGFKTLRA